jgi:hypothetical protein
VHGRADGAWKGEKVDERGKECIDHGYVECIGGGEGAYCRRGRGALTGILGREGCLSVSKILSFT